MPFSSWSAEKAHGHMQSHWDPRKSASTLLSSKFTFKQKAGWILDMPLSAINYVTNLKLLEADLDNAGCNELARLLCWCSFWNNVSLELRKQDMEWSQSAVLLDIEARWIVQRDRYLEEEVQALEKSLVLSADSDKENVGAFQCKLDAYKKELQCLNTEYNTLHRRIWQLEGICPVVPSKELSRHTERITIGISANGYARTVQVVVVAVAEAVDVAKDQEQHPEGHAMVWIVGIALVLFGVAFVPLAILKVK